ncbi:hypothetical protein F5X97DRAFT_301657 [Nemania serpens]|nr:hypothetical protein F5X97DRAFT_301657 [Nemania serpens]
MRNFIGSGNESPYARGNRISDEIERILESLKHQNEAMEELTLPTALKATLKTHQEDGIRFIHQRETEAVSCRHSERLRQVARIRCVKVRHLSPRI